MEIKKTFENIKPFFPLIILLIIVCIYNQILTPFVMAAAIAYLIYPVELFLEKHMPFAFSFEYFIKLGFHSVEKLHNFCRTEGLLNLRQ